MSLFGTNNKSTVISGNQLKSSASKQASGRSSVNSDKYEDAMSSPSQIDTSLIMAAATGPLRGEESKHTEQQPIKKQESSSAAMPTIEEEQDEIVHRKQEGDKAPVNMLSEMSDAIFKREFAKFNWRMCPQFNLVPAKSRRILIALLESNRNMPVTLEELRTLTTACESDEKAVDKYIEKRKERIKRQEEGLEQLIPKHTLDAIPRSKEGYIILDADQKDMWLKQFTFKSTQFKPQPKQERPPKPDYFKTKEQEQRFQIDNHCFWKLDKQRPPSNLNPQKYYQGLVPYEEIKNKSHGFKLISQLQHSVEAKAILAKEVSLCGLQVHLKSKDAVKTQFLYVIGEHKLNLFRIHPIADFLTKCFHECLPTHEVAQLLFRYTNCCLYHLGGCCIHPECAYNHDDDSRELLHIYSREIKKSAKRLESIQKDARCKKAFEPIEAVTVAQEWKEILRRSFTNAWGEKVAKYLNYTRVMHLMRSSSQLQPTSALALKTIRQHVMGQVHECSEALKFAWAHFIYDKPDGVVRKNMISDHRKQVMEKVMKTMRDDPSQELIQTVTEDAYSKPYRMNSYLHPMKAFNYTRLNTCFYGYNKAGQKVEILHQSHTGMLQFDDSSIFQTNYVGDFIDDQGYALIKMNGTFYRHPGYGEKVVSPINKTIYNLGEIYQNPDYSECVIWPLEQEVEAQAMADKYLDPKKYEENYDIKWSTRVRHIDHYGYRRQCWSITNLEGEERRKKILKLNLMKSLNGTDFYLKKALKTTKEAHKVASQAQQTLEQIKRSRENVERYNKDVQEDPIMAQRQQLICEENLKSIRDKEVLDVYTGLNLKERVKLKNMTRGFLYCEDIDCPDKEEELADFINKNFDDNIEDNVGIHFRNVFMKKRQGRYYFEVVDESQTVRCRKTQTLMSARQSRARYAAKILARDHRDRVKEATKIDDWQYNIEDLQKLEETLQAQMMMIDEGGVQKKEGEGAQ